jgi:hypothetical protein
MRTTDAERAQGGGMAAHDEQLEKIIDRLVKDVEQAVHALYRGDVRQNTVRARTEVHRNAARDALLPLLRQAALGGAVPSPAPAAAGDGLSADERSAITRCIMAWLPMGPPASAAPDSRCVPAGRELAPSWAERELARGALKRNG